MKKIFCGKGKIASAAIFMSGSGTNAEKLIESVKKTAHPVWKPAVIVTDAPKTSRASEIAQRENIPLAALDIREFYHSFGEKTISIKTDKGRQIREKWTCELKKLIAPFNLDFGIFAGFVPLTNITDSLLCLNVHPGDLTIEEDGQRMLVGLHTIPVERAILANHKSLRSSVILAQPYTGAGGNMDSGPILGVSPPVPVNLYGCTPDELKKCAEQRPLKRPKGGYNDILETVAQKNLEQLKISGDWVVFPAAVSDFAAGKFALDEQKNLYYLDKKSWLNIKTIEYKNNNTYKLIT